MKFPFGAGAIFKGELLVSGRVTIGYHWWKATCGLQGKHTETSQAMRCIFKSFRKNLEKFHSIFPSKISMPISSSGCFFRPMCYWQKNLSFRKGRKKKKTHTSSAQINLMIWTWRLVKSVWTLHFAEGPIPPWFGKNNFFWGLRDQKKYK